MNTDAFSVSQAALTHGDAPFIVTETQTRSFAEIARLVSRACETLIAQGVRAGQETPVALKAENELPVLIQLLALVELAVPALLLHPRWSSSETSRALAAAGHSQKVSWPQETALAEPQPLPATASATAFIQSPIDGNTTLAIVFTSGSSGEPKGVALSRRAFLVSAAASAENLGWEPHDRWLLSLPLAHVGGLSVLLRCLAAGRTVVVPRAKPGRTASTLYDELQHYSVSLCSLVPTQLQRLLALELPCPKTLRAVLLGGAPASQTLLTNARDLNYPVLATYGLTECCSQVTTQPYNKRFQVTSGVGTPLAGTEVKIIDGRIAIRSGSLLSGYHPRDAAPLTDDGFFVSCDAGMIDARGHLHVLGRSDDVIVSGGENVHPEEVEACLLEHPRLANCSVFGQPDDEFGECVCAALVGDCTPDELRTHLSSHLAGFKRPKRVLWVDELPLTPSGKVARREAKQLYGELCRPLS